MKDDGFFLGLELHDASIWETARMDGVISCMAKRGYNVLILHQNDLLDSCTHLAHGANFGVYDLRWKGVCNRVAWLAKIIRKLEAIGAKLYLQVKEPSCHDYALELYPELIGADGRIDPTSDAWLALCRRKTEAITASLPGLGGLIVNVSSPESRVSLQDYLAEHGKSIDLDGWFDRMIEAFYMPVAAAGMKLFIRDFAYTKEMQGKVMAAVDRRGGKVGASIKITPHDYFPESKNNESARSVKAPKFIEFEAFGEHMGWGLVPNCRVAEFCERMKYVREIGAIGVAVRVSWEAITGPHALDCLSDVNVYALPRLMRGEAAPQDIVCDWLAERYGMDKAAGATRQAAEILLESWAVVAAAYWDGRVFPRHSRLPTSWQEGLHSMLTTGMGSRNQSGAPKLEGVDRAALFAVKEKAVKSADDLARRVEAIRVLLPPALAAQMVAAFEWLPLYARQFDLATRGAYFAATDPAGNADEIAAIQRGLDDLATKIETLLAQRPDAPHSLGVLFDPALIRRYAQSLAPASADAGDIRLARNA